MEKIDILLATYNGQKYLKEQLESILNQTYKNFNLIISDDASNDDTCQIINEYAKKDKRIKVINHKENLGVIYNFESLLENVQNEYFMFSDQDDIWKENKIQICLDKLKSEDSDLVYSDLEIVNEKLEVIYPSYWKYKGIYKKIKKYNNYEALYLNNFITGCTILAKSKFKNIILPLPKTSKYVLHDYWTALMISQKGKISYVEEPTIKYRQHKNNKVGSKRKSDQLESFEEIRKLFIDVKLEHFKIFKENENRFDKNIKINNYTDRAYEYFQKLNKTKYINFKNWILFFKLYKYETFSYKIQNFLVLNLPILGKFAFKIKKKLKNKV